MKPSKVTRLASSGSEDEQTVTYERDSSEKLRRRAVGLVKAIDEEMQPGAREFALGAVADLMDERDALHHERDALRAALEQLIEDVEAALPAVRSAESIAHIHGLAAEYKGKTLPTAIEEARQALVGLEEK